MSRAALVCFALVACTTPPPAAPTPWKPSDGTIVPSSDRAHPTKLAPVYVRPYTHEQTLELDVPAAGDWWFEFASSSPPNTDYRVEVSLDVKSSQLWDFTTEVVSPVDPFTSNSWWVEKLEGPRRWLLRVSTTKARQFFVTVMINWSAVHQPDPPPPPEFPPCDPVHPDYANNPNCCYMEGCALQRGHCEAKVTKLLYDHKSFEIDRGGKRGVMVGARVRVAEGGYGIVSTVWAETSIVEVDGSGGDKIGIGRTAYLSTPAACTAGRR